MNPVTLTDRLVKSVRIAYPDLNSEQVPKIQKTVPTKPLLTYHYDSYDEVQEILNIAGSTMDLFKTPFEQFRYYITFPMGEGLHIMEGYCETNPQSLRTVVLLRSPESNGSVFKVMLYPPKKPGALEWKVRAFSFDTQEEYTKGHLGRDILPPEEQKRLDTTVLVLLAILEGMCIEYMRPGSHLATVEPNAPTKSVEWRHARTHWTVIHRTHKANSKQVQEGSVVVQDQNRHLTRVAHSRRAYKKLLRSPRFKNKQGQEIFVRSTWVGPKEWKDENGQIYRIAQRAP